MTKVHKLIIVLINLHLLGGAFLFFEKQDNGALKLES